MNKSNERIKIQQQWEYSKRKLHHSISIEQMAKRLRLNLENFGRFHDLEKKLWADPLPDFIISLYEKRFGSLGYGQTDDRHLTFVKTWHHYFEL